MTWIELDTLTKSYRRRHVLKKASMRIAGGEIIGLVGANGAGKTTLLRIAAGLVRADSGSVRHAAGTVTRYFGGEMTLPGGVRGSRWAALFGIDSAERRPIGRLSRGTRQLLGLQVVLADPAAHVLLLDEPWEGLDPGGSCWLSQTIRTWRDTGAAVLVSSHRLHDLEDVCTRVVMLADGQCARLFNGDEPGRGGMADAVRAKMAPA